MARKDKPRAEQHRPAKHTHDEEMETRRQERREQKHAFNILRRRVQRTGHSQPQSTE
jgi:hypothetical protein